MLKEFVFMWKAVLFEHDYVQSVDYCDKMKQCINMLFICEIEVIILFCRGSWIKVLIKEQKKQQVLKVKIIIWIYHFIVYLISCIIGVITIHCAVVRESLNTHPFLLDLSALWVKFINTETHTPAHPRTIQEETHKEIVNVLTQ